MPDPGGQGSVDVCAPRKTMAATGTSAGSTKKNVAATLSRRGAIRQNGAAGQAC